MKSLPYSRQSISKDDIRAVVSVLQSDFLTTGPKIPKFEKKIAAFTGAKYAVVLNSGTSALHAAYFAADLKAGDEVLTSAMTFAATANAALYLNGKPVFADIDPGTGNVDLSALERKISHKTKIVAPVHYSGNPVDLKEVQKLRGKHHFTIIDDASHALGSSIHGSMIGSGMYSDMTIFSFHPVKHITTGEGGAVVTNNKRFYERLMMFRTHGITKDPRRLIRKSPGNWYHEMQFLGFNYRMPDIQAALGISQMKRVKSFIKKRQAIARTYNKAFKDNPFFDVISETKDGTAVYHLYPILIKDKTKKAKIFRQLHKHGLGVQTHYIPVYLHPYYEQLGYKKGLCPKAEEFYEREISIPNYPSMSTADIQYTIETITSVCKAA